MKPRRQAVRPARARKIILIILVLILVVIIALPFVALPIAGSIAKGVIIDTLETDQNKTVSIDNVALTWKGGQRIEGLRYKDAAAGIDAVSTLSSPRSIMDLINNPLDLGTVTLSTYATIAQPTAAPAKPADAPAPGANQGAPTAPAQPFKLPDGFMLDLTIEPSTITLVALDPADPSKTIESRWTNVQGAAQLKNSTDLVANLQANGPTANERVRVEVSSLSLFSPTGEFRLRGARTDVAVTANIAEPSLAALRHVANLPPELAAGKDNMRIFAQLANRNGVLTLANPEIAPTLSAAIAPQVMRTITPLAEDAPHDITLTLSRFALPLADDPNQPVDLANLEIEALVESAPITLPLQLNPDAEPTPVTIEGLMLRARAEKLAGGLRIIARAQTAAEGQPAGSLFTNTLFTRLIAPDGSLDPAGLYFTSEVEVTALPTPLIAPWLEQLNLDLTAGLGPSVTLYARVEPELSDDMPDRPTDAPLLATITMNSEHAQAAAGLRYVPGEGITQWEQPIAFQAFNAVELLKPRIDEQGLAISGVGTVLFQLSDFSIPLKPDNTPDLAGASGVFRLVAGDMDYRPAPDKPAISITNFDTEIRVAPNTDPTISTIAKTSIDATPLTARGNFRLAFYDITNPADFSRVQPLGQLNASDIPVDLLRIISPNLAQRAKDLVGETVSASFIAPPPNAGATRKLGALELQSSKLTASVVADYKDGAAEFTDARATLVVDPETADRLLAKDGQQPPLRLAEQTSINFEIDDVALGPGDTPFAPGRFRLQSKAFIESLALVIPGENDESGRLNLTDTNATIRSTGAAKPQLTIDIESKHADTAADPFTATATLDNFATAQGALSTETAVINATANGGLPTPFIDAITRSPGTYTSILGPTTNIDLRATNLSASGGNLRAIMITDRANAELSGTIKDGAFVTDATTIANLETITPATSAMLFEKALPFLTSIQKTTDDDPANLTIENLAIPIDGDMRKLSGRGTFDPGTIQFQSSDLFSRVLNATSNNAMGTVGRKVEPINFTMDRGVIRYEQFTLPAGEFDIITEGKVNLVNNKLDVLVSVPLYALSKEFAATVGQIPGLDRVTSVPIRFSGETNKPEVKVDMELFLQRIPESLLGGAKDGAQGVGGLLDGIFKEIEKEISGDDDDKKKKKKDKEQSDNGGQ